MLQTTATVTHLSTPDIVQRAAGMFYLSRAYVLRYVTGARAFQHNSLSGYHYDKPLWWETDAFQAVNVDPAEVIRLVNDYKPGPHLIGVVTTDPEGIVPSYEALGYTTTPNEPMEILMARSLTDFAPSVGSFYDVQVVTTEEQRRFYNSAIDADDPHCQITTAELDDPRIRYYFVEQDGQCVCTGRAILPTGDAVTVEPLETNSNYRRRGIACALMNRVHQDAANQGAKSAVIVANPLGQKLYATLGYKVVAYIQKFIPATML